MRAVCPPARLLYSGSPPYKACVTEQVIKGLNTMSQHFSLHLISSECSADPPNPIPTPSVSPYLHSSFSLLRTRLNPFLPPVSDLNGSTRALLNPQRKPCHVLLLLDFFKILWITVTFWKMAVNQSTALWILPSFIIIFFGMLELVLGDEEVCVCVCERRGGGRKCRPHIPFLGAVWAQANTAAAQSDQDFRHSTSQARLFDFSSHFSRTLLDQISSEARSSRSCTMCKFPWNRFICFLENLCRAADLCTASER